MISLPRGSENPELTVTDNRVVVARGGREGGTAEGDRKAQISRCSGDAMYGVVSTVNDT